MTIDIDPFWSLITFYRVEGHTRGPFTMILIKDCPPMGDSLLFSLFPHGHFIKVYPINEPALFPQLLMLISLFHFAFFAGHYRVRGSDR